MKHAHSRAREAALKALYQADVLGRRPDPQAVEELLQRESLGDRAEQYARKLVNGCLENQDRIDELIQGALKRWELKRLAAIDRCILRLGTYELLFEPDVPPKVSINEAIDLAKRYSTEQSGAFINGILDRIRRNHLSAGEPPEGTGGEEPQENGFTEQKE